MKTNKNSKKIFKIGLFLLGIGIIFSLGINVTAAANSSSIYVSTHGNDSWDGLNSTYTSGTNGPKATIKNATGTVTSNGTVYIASGTYNESNIQIATNMNIVGESQKNTIINGPQKFGNPIFTIASGVNVTIINLTLNDGNILLNNGGAIDNSGNLTVNSSTFTNNKELMGNGGAICNENGGTLTVDNSTFNNNSGSPGPGGAIDNSGTLIVENSIFTNNSAIGYDGGAINNENGGTLTVNTSTFTGSNAADGGAIDNSGTLIIENSIFTNNSADSYGGAINNENGGTLTVNTSTFTGNNAISAGGAICNSGTATVNFNRIVGNTVHSDSAIYNSAGKIDARYNWWGSNTSPSDEISGSGVTYNPWIVLTVIETPNGSNSTVTADLLHDSNGMYHDPVNGHVPDGIIVNFSSTNGSVNPTSTVTTNDTANTTFTGHSSGVSQVSTTVDYQTITINKSGAYLYLQITSTNKNPKVGEPFTLTYKLGNKGPDNATNTIVTIPLPSNFNVLNITGNGNWTYNKTTDTVTWTLTNVTIGDPYLYITGKTNNSGIYVFGSNITSETYNLNNQSVTPITIKSKDPTTPITPTNPTNPTTPTNTTTTILNAATTTIPMQHTGVPIAGLILAILSVIGGSIMSHRR
jgi:hypothetical protein